MTTEQVANMFAEAQRMDSKNEYRKLLQNGLYSRSDSRNLMKKDTEFNLSMAMDPEAWKVVTKSPAALKSKPEL